MAALAIAVAAVSVVAWLGGRESVLQWFAQRVVAAGGGKVQLDGVSGSLYGPIRIASLTVDSGAMRTTAAQVEVRWRLARLWRPEIAISALRAGDVAIETGAAPSPAPTASGKTKLPLSLKIEQAHIEKLRVTAVTQPVEFSGVELSGWLNDTELRVDVRGNGGGLHAIAALALDDARSFQLSLESARLDLAALTTLPHSTINAAFTGRGTLAPFSISADWRVQDSRFNGEALASRGRVEWTQQSTAQLDVALRLADNEIRAAGAFGHADDVLTWRLSLPRLAKFGPGFSGSASAEGSLRGGIAHPTLVFKLAADRLALFGAHRLHEVRAQGRFGAGTNDPFSGSLVAIGYRGPRLRLDRGTVTIVGTRSAHDISLYAQNSALQFKTAARGAWRGESWRGEVVQMSNRGSLPFTLQSPAKLTVARDGIDVSNATFSIAGGQLALAHLVQRGTHLRTRGQARAIAVQRLRLLLPALPVPLHASLSVDARWDLTAADTVDGEVTLSRRHGDVVIGSAPALALGLSELAADARIERNRVQFTVAAAGKELGRLNARGQALLTQQDGVWTLKRDAPFALNAGAHIPSLAWLGKFSPAPLILAGRVDADLHADGSLDRPQWRGTMQGAGLGLKLPSQGLDWHGGGLAAQLDGAQFKVQRLRVQAGEGQLLLEGWVGIDGATGDFLLTANQARVTRTPTRAIVASGNGRIRLQERQLEINGDIRVDRARIALPKQEGVTQSSDVVVVGRESQSARASLPFSPQLKVNIDFGERFYIKGHGVDARLAGRIELLATDTGLPVGRGSVSVAEGTYSAYGQRLQIDRGVLTFNGPVDNPALDILALRKNQEVQAGVAVTGTALSPRVKLVSIPEVPDSEKLAWLVLGHGLNQASGKDFDLLSAAAGSILARGESVSLQAQIAQRVGLDEFRVSGRGELEETIVTLGKRLSSDVYVAYQRSVSGTTNVFTVKYKLSSRWSLQTQTGPLETAADLLYTLSFD